MGSSNEHIVDIEQISTSIEKELEILHPLSDECCIYRVPNILRRSNEEAYTPQEVSIGPLHHGRPELKPMEEIKRRYLQEFLLLSNSTMSLKEYVKFIEERETKLRNCYAETIEMNSEDLVKMILIDSAFLIMVFLKFSCKELQTGNDRLFSKPWKEFDVRYDMILLENQLPFFILKDLFDVSDIRNKLQLQGLSLLKLTHEFLKIKWKSWVTDEVSEEHNFSQVHHILDFLRICRRPSTMQMESKLSKQIFLHAPSATQLHQAGVKFELSPSKNKFDIQFEHGILKIPRLRVTKRTEFYLRNLQAFEQCHCNDDNRYTSDYIAFITMLVRTPKDVEVLAQSGVAQNRLRNNDTMSSLLNNLGTGNFVSRTRFHFSDIVEELNKYCENSLHKWKATLKQDYFNTPWAGISVATAAILLLLTLIQTVCSIIQI